MNDRVLMKFGQFKYHAIKSKCQYLRFFWPEITSKKFKSNIFRLNSTRAIDWCMNCRIWMKKKFSSIFTIRGDPYQKKVEIFFSS
jgi:hypothetical protein